ncbi:glycosyltransferase [Desulfovibrio sp. OttesenSCG-928-G15]|nr:glycosyltransferase [Desulfovibrio sp. OttesenSCG-928-G15]
MSLPDGPSTLRDLCLRYLRSLAERYQNTVQDYTLCFSFPFFVYALLCTPKNEQWPVFFKIFFKTAEFHYFMALSDQATFLQSMNSHLMIAAKISTWSFNTMTSLFDVDYASLIHTIDASFKERKIVLQFQSAQNNTSILDEFLTFAHIKKDDTFDLTSPHIPSPLPRDVLGFVDAVNRSSAYSTPENGPLPFKWTNEHSLLTSGEDPLPIFSPKEYSYLYHRYKASNSKLATMLGYRPEDLPPLEPRKKWTPAAKISIEQARRFLSLLSQPARRALENILQPHPEYELWHEPRVVRRALSGTRYAKDQATVSVLTLTYNHERFIAQNIQSVIDQKTDFPVEHIIVDDGSADATQRIILQYAKEYAHITPVLRKGGTYTDLCGPSPRRLFNMASTEYVSLCDGDDYFCDPDKLQKQYTFLRENPRYSICFHPVLIDWEETPERNCLFPGPRDLPPHKQPYTLTDLVRWNFMSTSSVMYRWRFREGLPYWFFESALPGDWYWHMLHAEVGRIGMLYEAMSVYRRHSGGIWKYAETDLVRHKEKHGVRELGTYIAMDKHFDGRFRKLFADRILWEFSFLYKISVENNIGEPFENAIKLFPEWATEVLEMIKGSGQK